MDNLPPITDRPTLSLIRSDLAQALKRRNLVRTSVFIDRCDQRWTIIKIEEAFSRELSIVLHLQRHGQVFSVTCGLQSNQGLTAIHQIRMGGGWYRAFQALYKKIKNDKLPNDPAGKQARALNNDAWRNMLLACAEVLY